MPLIPCPACEHQISDMAPACLKCGHPMARATASTSAPFAEPGRVITTQQTSKVFKLIQLAGVLMICAGAVACSGGKIGATAELFGFGLLLWVGGRLGAWWNNG